MKKDTTTNTTENENNDNIYTLGNKTKSKKNTVGLFLALFVIILLAGLSYLICKSYLDYEPNKTEITQIAISDTTSILSNSYGTFTWNNIEDQGKLQELTINLNEEYENLDISTNFGDMAKTNKISEKVYLVEFQLPDTYDITKTADKSIKLEAFLTSSKFKKITISKQIGK